MTAHSGPARSEAITTYIRAKDENRPYLMPGVFVADAILEMVVKSGTISFPPISRGLEPITDVLVRRFAQTYENVYTFCLGPLPPSSASHFSCNWLVGMSEKDGGAVRVGCGRYDWLFQAGQPGLVERLTVTIEWMQTLPAKDLGAVMDWLSGLPYPWCPIADAAKRAPVIDALQPIVAYLEHSQ